MQRDACQAVLDQQGFALRANSGNKQLLLELGGALKVLTKQEKHRLPAPPPPPPPPNAERLFSWHLLERRRKHVKRHVLKLISSVGRHDATAWGKLKSVALMVPDTSRFPPTPIPTPVPTPTPTPTPNPNPNPNPNLNLTLTRCPTPRASLSAPRGCCAWPYATQISNPPTLD